MNNKYIRWAIVAVFFVFLLRFLGMPPFDQASDSASSLAQDATEIAYSDIYTNITDQKVKQIEYQQGSGKVFAQLDDSSVVFSPMPPGSEVIKFAQENGVEVNILPADPPSFWARHGGWLIVLISIGLICLVFLYIHRKQMEAMRGMGRPDKAGFKGGNMIDPEKNTVRLKDVAGNEQAKQEVAEIIHFLKEPEVYHNLGANKPRGVLMSGPPGTGKTLLAKAIAGEAQVPFFSVSGSDFVEVFVGVGAGRVRNLFEMAKKSAPSIIFIDEIDSIGRQRSGSGQMDNSERESTLMALLVEMDGFDANTDVVVIGATNRSDVLDEALTRPGRFDREVSMGLPDKSERTSILQVHARKIPLDAEVNLENVAAGSPGFSGADLANLVNEAAIMAARERVKLVSMRHFEEARDKVIMGVARSPLRNPEERRVIAYHEAGHAIVARFTEAAEPVHKISIVPRGRALGVTVQLPKEDSYNHSQERLEGDIAVLMGGRAAEDIVIGRRTTGASNDFMRATVLARRMIATWGMDPDFGPVSLDGERGNEYAGTTIWSEQIKIEADRKIQKLLKDKYAHAVELLRTHEKSLHAVAQALLEEETVDADRFEELVRKAEGIECDKKASPLSEEEEMLVAPSLDPQGEVGTLDVNDR